MQMQRISRGKNIVEAGYEDGVLAVRFTKSGEYRWAGVPQDKFESLLRTPYPDRYFTQAIKSKFTVIQKPEKQDDKSDGRLRSTDPTARRDDKPAGLFCDSSPSGDHRAGGLGHRDERNAVLRGCVHDSRRDDGSPKKDSRLVMEIFRAEQGLTFTAEDHRYMLDGKRVMSLTQILAASGIAREPQSEQERQAWEAKRVLGTKVHEYTVWSDADDLDMEELRPYPKYWTRVEGWRQFRQDFRFVPDPAWSEIPCAVRVNGMLYSMTLDRFGFMDPEPGKDESSIPCVVEVKCTFDREFSHHIQTAGQAIPFKGDGSVPPVKRFAVYLLDKLNGANRYYTVQEHTDRMDEKIFLASLVLTHARINNGLLK